MGQIRSGIVSAQIQGGYVLNRNDALNALGQQRDPVGNGEILAALQALPTRIADELAVR